MFLRPMFLRLVWLCCASLLAVSTDILAQSEFDYDRNVPLQPRVLGQLAYPSDVVVTDIQFTGGTPEQKQRAWLVAPRASGERPLAAVLFVHWGGTAALTHRDQFLDEAIVLARRGTVALLPDAMWADRDWWPRREWENDLPQGVNQVIALRRGIDLLLAQPGVDPARLGLVGHDLGAVFGSVLAAVDGRLHATVLLTPTTRLSDWYLQKGTPPDPAGYQSALAVLDPISALPKLSQAAVLLQFGEADPQVPADRIAALEAALQSASHKSVRKYPTRHELHLEKAARADRFAWLQSVLALPDSDFPGSGASTPAEN